MYIIYVYTYVYMYAYIYIYTSILIIQILKKMCDDVPMYLYI